METMLSDLELLRGKTFPVLDAGFVKLVDAYGSDQRIIEAARLTAQSTGKGPKEDRNLLRYLLRNHHGTPFEFPVLTVHIRIPMDAWRQGVRHRTFSINEYSTRYSPAIDAMAKTDPNAWRTQSTVNRQGSSDKNVDAWPAGYPVLDAVTSEFEPQRQRVNAEGMTAGEYLTARESELHGLAVSVYQERLNFGVAKEVSRKDLPLSNYTELYWQANLRNWLHFLGLRMDQHAQWEIRAYANVIGEELVAKLFPWTWEAFNDFELNSMSLTALDQYVIEKLLHSRQFLGDQAAIDDFMACQHPDWKDLKNCRERDESLAKLQRLGLVVSE